MARDLSRDVDTTRSSHYHQAYPSMTATSRTILGSERLLASRELDNRRIGIVANPASVDAGFRHIVQMLALEPKVRLGAIFGPQHGYQADVQDNMIETPHAQIGRAS